MLVWPVTNLTGGMNLRKRLTHRASPCVLRDTASLVRHTHPQSTSAKPDPWVGRRWYRDGVCILIVLEDKILYSLRNPKHNEYKRNYIS